MFVSSTRWTILLLFLIAGPVLADTNYNPFLNISDPVLCSADDRRQHFSLTDHQRTVQLVDLTPGLQYHLFVLPADGKSGCIPNVEWSSTVTQQQLEPGVYQFKATHTTQKFQLSGVNCPPDQLLTLSIAQITGNTPLPTLLTAGNIEISTDDYTVEQLIEDVFIGGDCFEIEPGSIQYSGDNESVGYFSSGLDGINMEEGIILSTGIATKAIGPNERYNTGNWVDGSASDNDLQDLLDDTYPLRDRAALEFDFTPTSEMISFEFVFASEEYCEYVDSDFNDVFGFFISGPGINGTFTNNAINIAVVPGSNDYISINSINHEQNQFFFNNNIPLSQHDNLPNALSCPELESTPDVAADFLEYDGFTKVLTAMADVIPCETYHIKLVISDVQDAYFDSAVFLKANSFSAGNTAQVSTEVPGFNNGILTEDCTEGFFRFDRTNDDLTEAVTIKFDISTLSTATAGVDYEALPDSIIIPAGSAFYNLPILAYNDDLVEGTESIVLEMEVPCSCDIPFSVINIQDGIPLEIGTAEALICEGEIGNLQADVTGGIGTLRYQWASGDTTAGISIQPTTNTDYQVTVTDQCGKTIEATYTVMVIGQPTATLDGSAIVCNTIPVAELPVTLTGTGPWNLEYTLNNVPQNPIVGILNPNYQLPVSIAGTYRITGVNSGSCIGTGAGIAEVEEVVLQMTSSTSPLTCLGASDGSLSVQPIGGMTPYTYQWNNGGATADLNSLDSGAYFVTVTDLNGCEFVNFVEIALDPEMPEVATDTPDLLTCDTTQRILTATASEGTIYQYLWTTQDGIIETGANSLTPQVSAPGAYQLEVINTTTGCRVSDMVLVEEDITPPEPVVFIQGPQTLTCDETATILDATASQPVGELSFLWSTIDGYLDPQNIDLPVPELDSAGTYQLILTNTRNGCTATQETTISLNIQTPEPVIISPSDLTCQDTMLTLDASASIVAGVPEYIWSTIDGNILTGNDGTTPAIDEPGTYQFIITDLENGCTNSQSITVAENVELPFIEITPPTETLDCDTETLTISSGTSSQGSDFYFLWSTNEGIITNGHQTPDVTIEASGVYHLQITDQRNGCTATAMTTVLQDETPPVAAITVMGEEVLNCNFLTTTISAQASTPTDNLMYQWMTTDGVLAVDEMDQVSVEIADAGHYQLMVTNMDNACTDQASVFIGADKTFPIIEIANPDVLDCYQDSVSLSAANSDQGINFENNWTTINGNITGDPAAILTAVDQPGTYQLSITNLRNGCSAEATIDVSENREPPVAMIVPVTELLDCNTPTLTLMTTAALTATDELVWKTMDGFIFTDTTASAVEVNQAGQYELWVTDTENGCTAMDGVVVEENENRPDGIATAINAPLCFGETGSVALVSVTGGEGPYLYALDDFDGVYYPDTLYENLTPGVYMVSVQDMNGCFYNTSVEIPGVPELIVETEPEFTIPLGASQDLLATVNVPDFRIDSLIWNPTVDDLCESCYEITVQPFNNTTYTVTAIDEDGCISTSQTLVIVDKEPRVFIPNAFSPNSDGANDRVTVFSNDLGVAQVNTFQIFSRWGEKVYENNNFQPNLESEGWDGWFKGKLMMNGVYVFFAEVELVDGSREIFEGDITILK